MLLLRSVDVVRDQEWPDLGLLLQNREQCRWGECVRQVIGQVGEISGCGQRKFYHIAVCWQALLNLAEWHR